MDYEVGDMVISTCGHDQGITYVIIEVEGEYLKLVDGKLRILKKPKRKNKKHIQLYKRKAMIQIPVTNEEIRYAIKMNTKCCCDN